MAQATTRYETDPPHTFVTFAVKHFNTSTVLGRFDKVDGWIELDDTSHRGTADITIDARSIDTGTPAFDEHLRSDAFFNVAEHPEAHFVGNRLTWAGDKLAKVSGQLTLLGVTHPVTLDSTSFNRYESPYHQTEVLGGDFETTIQRSEWGMTFGLDIGIPDAVKLFIQIEALKK